MNKGFRTFDRCPQKIPAFLIHGFICYFSKIRNIKISSLRVLFLYTLHGKLLILQTSENVQEEGLFLFVIKNGHVTLICNIECWSDQMNSRPRGANKMIVEYVMIGSDRKSVV